MLKNIHITQKWQERGERETKNKENKQKTNKMVDLNVNHVNIICKWPKCIKLRDCQIGLEIKTQLYPISKSPTLNTG